MAITQILKVGDCFGWIGASGTHYLCKVDEITYDDTYITFVDYIKIDLPAHNGITPLNQKHSFNNIRLYKQTREDVYNYPRLLNITEFGKFINDIYIKEKEK